jgi:hypothetical protein
MTATNDALNAAANAVSLSYACLTDLAELFSVILSVSKEPRVQALAGMGHYLAEDWSNLVDIDVQALAQDHASDTRGDDGIDHLRTLRDARLQGAAKPPTT